MKKVSITPCSSGEYNREKLIEKLLQHGIEPVLNPYGIIMDEQQMRGVLQDMDGLIVGVDPVSKEALKQVPRPRAIAKYGVGIDNITCVYVQENDIAISRTVNANVNAIADYAMTLLISMVRRVMEIDEGCHHNDWFKKEALGIYGKTIGVLGLGTIGKGVVQRASGFDMRIYGYDIMRDDAFLNEYNVCFTDVGTIIRGCDFISLHLPLTQETRHTLNKENSKRAKSSLITVNTARGGLLDEDALYGLLKERKLYGLGPDVFEQEPPQNSKLPTFPNVIVSSHAVASTQEAINTMSRTTMENPICPPEVQRYVSVIGQGGARG